VEFDPFDYGFHRDPYPTYRWLRDDAPLYHNERMDFWALSRFDDVLDGLHDPATYTSTEGVAIEHTDAAIKSMIELDPPEHTQMRKLIARRFTPRRIAELEPRIREWTNTLLDSLVRAGNYAKARAVWARLAHIPAADGLIFDPQFRDSTAPGPFNWTLASSTLGLAERQSAGRLHLLYYGQEDGQLASQLLVLVPGRYRLAMQVSGDVANAGGLVWTITCQGSNAVLATLPLSDAARLRQGVAFDVPKSCTAQALQLNGHAPEIPHQSDITVSNLRLTREGQNG